MPRFRFPGMKGRPAARLMAVLAALAALAGCTPESRHPLPDDTRILPDARFVGAWRGRSDEGAAIDSRIAVRIAADPDQPLSLRAHVVEDWTLLGQAHRRSGEFRLQFHDVAGRRLLAAQRLGERRDEPWRFAIYRFGGEDSRVVLNFMDEERIRSLVHAARLPGRIRGGEREFPDVLLTASPSQLTALVRATDPAVLFVPRLGPFERLP